MLDIVRNLVSSIFGKILLGIMVLSFALWGVGDILTSGNSQLAAKVGNEKITLDEFYNEIQKTVSLYNQQTNSSINLKEAKDLQLHNILLNDMIYSSMVKDYANNNKIFINDNSLKLIITSLPQFKSADGLFSETKYKNYIFNNFPNEEVFLKEIENTIYQGIIFENFNISNFLDKQVISHLFNYEGEKRSVKYFILDDEDLEIKLSDELLLKYYETEKLKYEVSQKTIIDYIEISLDQFVDLDSIDENKIIEYYDDNINLYIKEEKRELEFARFRDKESANEFYNVWSQNDPELIFSFMKNNEVELNKLQNFKLSENSFNDEIANSIFNLNINDVSSPLEYQGIGFYVFKLLNIEEKETQLINEVKNEIKKYLAEEAAYVEFDDTVNLADEMLLNDYDLNEIMDNLSNAEIVNSSSSESLINRINNEQIQLSFDQPIGFLSEIIFNDNAAFIYSISDKEESFIPEFSIIKEEVERDYIENEKKSRISSLADKILIDLQFKGFNKFEEYAKLNNLEIKELKNLKRNDNNFSKDSITSIFNINLEDNVKIVMDNTDIGIGALIEIIKPDSYISDTYYSEIENNIIQNFNTSLESIIGQKIIDNTDYEVYSQNIDKLFM